MFKKIPRDKPIRQLITKIPINLTLLNFTNITETILEVTNSLINPTETISETIYNVTQTDTPSSVDFLTVNRIFTILFCVITIFVVLGIGIGIGIGCVLYRRKKPSTRYLKA